MWSKNDIGDGSGRDDDHDEYDYDLCSHRTRLSHTVSSTYVQNSNQFTRTPSLLPTAILGLYRLHTLFSNEGGYVCQAKISNWWSWIRFIYLVYKIECLEILCLQYLKMKAVQLQIFLFL